MNSPVSLRNPLEAEEFTPPSLPPRKVASRKPALRNRPHHGRSTERKAESTEVSSLTLESGQAGAHGVCIDGKRQRQRHAPPNSSTLETKYSPIGQIFAGCTSRTGESRLLSDASGHCLCGWAGVSGPHGCMGHWVTHLRDRRTYLDAAPERSPDCARVTRRSGAIYLDETSEAREAMWRESLSLSISWDANYIL